MRRFSILVLLLFAASTGNGGRQKRDAVLRFCDQSNVPVRADQGNKRRCLPALAPRCGREIVVVCG